MGITILHVEDEAIDRDLFALGLRRVRAEAVYRAVPDALEAQDYLRGTGPYTDRARNPFPDLIVLDLKLPVISGAEFMEWLKESPFKGVPVVVLTDSPDERLVRQMRSLGALMTIPKPAPLGKLEAVAQQLSELELRKDVS